MTTILYFFWTGFSGAALAVPSCLRLQATNPGAIQLQATNPGALKMQATNPGALQVQV